MSDQTSLKSKIQSEELVYNRPVAESTIKKIGGSINYLIDTTDTNTSAIATNVSNINLKADISDFSDYAEYTPTLTTSSAYDGSQSAFSSFGETVNTFHRKLYDRFWTISFHVRNLQKYTNENYVFFTLPSGISVSPDCLVGSGINVIPFDFSSTISTTVFGIYSNKLWIYNETTLNFNLTIRIQTT